MMIRNTCPACRANQVDCVLELAFENGRFQDRLKACGLALPSEWVAGQHYTILACPDCGALFQRTVLRPEQMSRLYHHQRQESATAGLPSLTSLAHCAQEVFLLRQTLEAPCPRVLDYGMGWGQWATLAQALGCEVDGVEINDPARERARSRGIRVLTDAELADAAYDYIQADQVLEHLTDPLDTAAMLARKLKPGGLMLVGVPGSRTTHAALLRAAQTSEPAQRMTRRDLDVLAPFVHVNLFSNRSLKILGAKAGLELFRPSPLKTLAAGTLWNTPRQWNRNLYLPIKTWLARGTRLWFRRPHAGLGSGSFPPGG